MTKARKSGGSGAGSPSASRPLVLKAVLGPSSPAPAKAAPASNADDDQDVSAPGSSKPFKNPAYKRVSGVGRRKNLKQILGSEKFSQWPVDKANYNSIAAPPPLIPPKKYCDITGLPTNYTDPKTRLQYYNSEVYAYINSLAPASVQAILALRNAAIKLS